MVRGWRPRPVRALSISREARGFSVALTRFQIAHSAAAVLGDAHTRTARGGDADAEVDAQRVLVRRTRRRDRRRRSQWSLTRRRTTAPVRPRPTRARRLDDDRQRRLVDDRPRPGPPAPAATAPRRTVRTCERSRSRPVSGDPDGGRGVLVGLPSASRQRSGHDHATDGTRARDRAASLAGMLVIDCDGIDVALVPWPEEQSALDDLARRRSPRAPAGRDPGGAARRPRSARGLVRVPVDDADVEVRARRLARIALARRSPANGVGRAARPTRVTRPCRVTAARAYGRATGVGAHAARRRTGGERVSRRDLGGDGAVWSTATRARSPCSPTVRTSAVVPRARWCAAGRAIGELSQRDPRGRARVVALLAVGWLHRLGPPRDHVRRPSSPIGVAGRPHSRPSTDVIGRCARSDVEEFR